MSTQELLSDLEKIAAQLNVRFVPDPQKIASFEEAARARMIRQAGLEAVAKALEV